MKKTISVLLALVLVLTLLPGTLATPAERDLQTALTAAWGSSDTAVETAPTALSQRPQTRDSYNDQIVPWITMIDMAGVAGKIVNLRFTLFNHTAGNQYYFVMVFPKGADNAVLNVVEPYGNQSADITVPWNTKNRKPGEYEVYCGTANSAGEIIESTVYGFYATLYKNPIPLTGITVYDSINDEVMDYCKVSFQAVEGYVMFQPSNTTVDRVIQLSSADSSLAGGYVSNGYIYLIPAGSVGPDGFRHGRTTVTATVAGKSFPIQVQKVTACAHGMSDESGICVMCGWDTHVCDGGSTLCPGFKFADMPDANDWSHTGIDYMLTNGYMAGVSNTRFRPDYAMTRSMLVSVLYRIEGSPAVTYAPTFGDVPEGQWFTNGILWAAEQGIVSGVGNGNFEPNGNITREQIASILYRYCQYKGYDVSERAELEPFPDCEAVSSWAETAMAWAVARGFISGTKDETGTVRLSPGGNATRAMVASILMRVLNADFEPAPEEPTEPTDPTEEPTEPAEPTEPTEPADPTEEQPADPTEEQPAEPTEEQPAEPTEEQPTDPTEEQPAEPTEEEPADPTEAAP